MDLVAVMIAGFLGSPHCAAMCGGFVALYANHSGPSIVSHGAYHLGRLTTYLTLGVLAGIFGRSINSLGVIVGLQSVAAVCAGGLLVFFGLRLFFGAASANSSAFHRAFTQVLSRIIADSRRSSGIEYAYITGLVSTLLPCGFLYVFVLAAAVDGSIMSAVLKMVAFWGVTIPSLLSVGIIAPRIVQFLGRRQRIIQGVLLCLAGAYSLWMHLAASHHHHMHHH